MLLLATNAITVGGVTVFPDHADPTQFWYLPAPVSLAKMPGSDEPQFTLIEYAPDVASSGVKGVGFLNVTLALTLSDDTREDIMGQIRDQFPNSGGSPKLAPAPFDEGTVQIVMLDMQGSGGTTSAAPPGTFVAVEKILGAVSPSLYGDNDALFAVTLSEEGASILEAAFENDMAPVGGIYNLKFTGVRPALDVKITADLKRCYQSFSVGLDIHAYFASVGIDATFEKLRQDGAIKIEVVNLAGDQSSLQAEQQAMSLFKDQILSKWFEPSLSPTTAQAADAGIPPLPNQPAAGTPPPPHPPAGGGGTQTMGGAQQHAPTMGGPTQTGAQMQQPHPPTPPTQQPHPPTPPTPQAGGGTQPNAGGNAPTPAGGGAQAPHPAPTGGTQPQAGAQTPHPAPTGGATPQPTAPHPAPTGGAQSGGANPMNAVNNAANTAQGVANALQGAASGATQAASPFGIALKLKFVSQDEQKTVTYEYNRMDAVQRSYAPQGYFGLMLNKIDRAKHFLKVDGNDPFFNHFAVNVAPPRDFASIGLQRAHVAIDYGDPSDGHGVKHGEFIFEPSNTAPQTWEVFQGKITSTEYRYIVDYSFDPESGWEGEDLHYSLPAVTTENRQLTLDPRDFLGFLNVAITPGRIDPDVVDRIDVNLQYVSKTGWKSNAMLTLRPGSPALSWKLRLADKTDTAYTYTTRCTLKDGTVFTSDPVTSTATAIVVNDPFNGAINLNIQPAFDPAKTKADIVEIVYRDPSVDYIFQNTLTLQGTVGTTRLRIPILDRSKVAYQYRITTIDSGNHREQGVYVTSEDPLLIVGDTP